MMATRDGGSLILLLDLEERVLLVRGGHHPVGTVVRRFMSCGCSNNVREGRLKRVTDKRWTGWMR